MTYAPKRPFATQSFIVATAATVILGMVSCSSSTSQNQNVIATWTLETADAGIVSIDIDETLSTQSYDGVVAWVQLDDSGGLMGEGPCNSFHGSYTIDGDVLRPIDVITSAVGCGPDDDIEQWLLGQLWLNRSQ